MLFFHNVVHSQCTGSDGTVTICDKETDSNYQTFNLFNHLNGTPEAGGTWAVQNPVIKNALSSSTGIVNLWAINQFGEYVFTYSHPNCPETSDVTIFLGGYPGENNITGGANTCSSNPAVDLFNFLDNNLTSLTADFNGTWSPDTGTPSGFLTESMFNAAAAGPGTYTFVYTVDAVDTCPERSAKVTIEVHRTPEPGNALNITICSSEDLSTSTSVDLFDHLTGEDSNGIWTDINGTGQITAIDDSVINIEEIFSNFGPGEYRFDYTVFPTHGICSEETTSVRIQIPNISANFSVANQCIEESLTFEIQHQRPNGVFMDYDLEYEIIDSNNVIAFSDTISGIQIADPTDPTIISHEVTLPNTTLSSGTYIIRTKEITNIQGAICSQFEVSEDTFVIFGTQINVPNTCYDSDLIDVTITNMVDLNGNQLNGDQLVNYTITNVTSNEELIITNQNVSFYNGVGILTLDLSSQPITDTEYTLSFNDVDTNGLRCINQNFTVRRNPHITGIFTVENQCSGNSLIINIEHQRLHPLEMTYDLEYEILDQTNTPIITETESNINISDNSNTIQNHQIDLATSNLPNGLYRIRTKQITNITDIECNDFTITEGTFTIFNPAIDIPDICYQNNNVEATITNLTDSNGILSNNTHIVSYTVTDLTTNQESVVTNQSISFINGKATISLDMSIFPKKNYDYNITFTTIPKDGTNCIDKNFIVRRKPNDISLGLTIDNSCDASDIEINIDAPILSNGEYIISYTVINLTTNQTLLTSGFNSTGLNSNFKIGLQDFDEDIYEVVLQSTQNDTTPCRDETEFEVRETFSIGGVPDKPVLDPNQSFCLPDFSPNLPALSDIQVTQGTNLTWYESETSNIPITPNTSLIDGVTYYVSSTNPDTNCESSERSNVTITFVTPEDIISSNTSPTFCAINAPTIADLEATANSGTVVWYDHPTDGNQLKNTTPLITGISYYAVENINGCEGANRLKFTVVVLTPITPNYSGETELCALDKLTLFDLESDFLDYFGHQLTWFDSSNGVNTLDSMNLIEENITYYIANVHESSGCESERLPITFSLKNCSEKDYDFFIPDGFSPNGDGINDSYFIPHIKYFYPKYTFEIFNRYGQSLFKGDINSPKWNGKNSSSGNDVTSGVYFYILYYNQDDKSAKQGRIYLSK
ncbi:gliding motility-associated C-terminal domain-containing protein [Tenacibaculum sp. nBUS_03]|uniref:gliding motility-associated C-terminal domain-containing protein n=1 Tax=Tenacibaculum sp. nBUS_03 TaxID=3395320 RepID=UPI003EBA8157